METPKLSPEVQIMCQKFHVLMEEAWNCKNTQVMDWMMDRAFQILKEIRGMGYPVEMTNIRFNDKEVDTQLTIEIPKLDTDEDRKNYDEWFAKTNGIAIDG